MPASVTLFFYLVKIIKFYKFYFKQFADKRLTSNESEDAKSQFDDFLSTEVVLNREKFLAFDVIGERLDTFLGLYLHKNTKYASLWKVMIFAFTLTHGQSQVERGFNINSDIVVENLKPESLCAQRMVYDQLKSDQVGSQQHCHTK